MLTKLEIKIAFLFLIILSFHSFSYGQSLNIVKNGQSDYRIIVAENPTDIENTASIYLQEFIFKSTGFVIPINNANESKSNHEILIGNNSRKPGKYKDYKFQEDEFIVYVEKNNLIFLGGEDKGVLYGVIDFIEKYLHCYIIAPDAEVINKTNDIIVSKHIFLNDKPYNTFRNVHGSFNQNERYKNWLRLDDVYDIFGDGYYVHTFNSLVPWEKHYADNPEFYAYFNNQYHISQLCLTNPEVQKRALIKLKHEMSKQPDRKYWSVSQNDNDSYCRCDKCMKEIEKEGSPSGLVLQFVNRIAAEFPDKIISTLAYSYTRHAPKITKPAKNVQIVLCTIELNRSKPIATDTTSYSFHKDIKEWSALTDNILIWDYTVDFAHSVHPFPNLHVLQPNIKFFNSYGVKSQFQQTNTQVGHENSELKSFMLSKILWNPNVNVDSVKKVFLDNYFGSASTYITEYLNHLEKEIIKSGERLDIYEHPIAHEKTTLNAKNLNYYHQLFDKAEYATKGNPTIFQRVKIARLPIQYTTMEIGKNYLFGDRGWYINNGNNFVLKPEMKNMLEDFYKTCINNNVKTLDESGLNPTDYYNSTLRFINVQTQDNLAFRKKINVYPQPNKKYSNGDINLLTNGVKGANDYNMHWLGWEGENTQITLDLEKQMNFSKITIGSLYYPKSWILHPKHIDCEVSSDGINFVNIGSYNTGAIQKDEKLNKDYNFEGDFKNIQFVRFNIEGTIKLPEWHYSAGGKSWFFLDEIIIK